MCHQSHGWEFSTWQHSQAPCFPFFPNGSRKWKWKGFVLFASSLNLPQPCASTSALRSLQEQKGGLSHCRAGPSVCGTAQGGSTSFLPFSLCGLTSSFFTSLKDFQLPLQEHVFRQPNIGAKASLSASRAIHDSRCWQNSRKPGHRGRR